MIELSKTNLGLVEYAKSKLGVPYVYGTKMEVLTKAKFDWLQKTYGKANVWDSDAKKIGKVCCDCSGLISSYTGVVQGSSQMKSTAKECRPINTIKEAPVGALVWQQGHVGIYIGTESGIPYYIAEDGSPYGCRKNKLSNAKFTHWLLMDYITYIDENKKTYPISQDNLAQLVRLGVITSPDYWLSINLQYLNEFCMNAIPKMDKQINRGIKDFKSAMNILVTKGIVSSPDYWAAKVNSTKYLDLLLINIANKLR